MNDIKFCGEAVSEPQIDFIQKTVHQYCSLSRTELAATICELLNWLRPNSRSKTVECRQFLESLEELGRLKLPTKRKNQRGKQRAIQLTESTASALKLSGLVRDVKPVQLRRIVTKDDRQYFRELIERHHYLGYQTPFGAHLNYFIEAPLHGILGAIQLSSPAWRMQVRDQWIGWDDKLRARRLQHIVSNSRFLILPSVNVRYLASHVLSLLSARIVQDWQDTYHIKPLLLETLVDSQRFSGTCYRAANWIELGQTSGRGRQDSSHSRHGHCPKKVLVYPLQQNVKMALQG